MSPDPSFNNPFSQAGQAILSALLKGIHGTGGAEPAAWASVSDVAVRLSRLQAETAQKHSTLWRSMLESRSEPVAVPERGDRRFASESWKSSPYFDYLRQSYLINARYLVDAVEVLELDPLQKERLRFATRQLVDAMSPANFAATNPDALKLALESRGETITRGILNLVEDVGKGRISTTDESGFEVGRNVAVSPGQVVFENDLMQLIQYAPSSDKVRARPLVIVPPCINKFYILDLTPENSFVRFAVERGNTVFMVSWRNITEPDARQTWDDYLDQGVIAALSTAKEISGADRVNALGFCVGGTLLGSALAVLAARGEEIAESVTLLASMLDFDDTGEIGMFVDEASVAARESAIGAGGLMQGRELAFVFSALRANDLVWSYVVNNYLKGRRPEAFDLLYWNADSTNLPGPMYCWYLRNMYLHNRLREPGALTMLGVPVDLGRISIPAYVLATREDHIVPWRTAYRTMGLISGERRFVLGASGHVAGIVNPASKNKRSFWVAPAGGKANPDSDAWIASAEERPGSWWSDWDAWLERFGGGPVAPRKVLGSRQHPPKEQAPGRYVKQRVA